jgi:murein DD-endopeptidase MepM/ murein hydrolase activator NlpD
VQPQSKALAFQPYLATSLHSKANVSLAFLDLVAAIAQESDPATPDAEAELKSVPVADTPAPQTVAFNTVAVPAVSNSINCYTPAPNAIGGQVVSTPTFGVLGMQFPLSIPSPITSLMGWRIHPISGDRRFHAGVDFGAPTGTPVVAAQAGRVAIADYIGGYGITVVLDHPTQGQQTLYAHLSQILVPPGTWVEAGAVIGRVGSTGNSTGPHLHFEVRQHTDRGWIAVNPISAFQP